MNHLEDEIKRRFENANSLDGLDADELWGNISNTLNEASVADEKKRRLPFAWWFLGLLLVCLLFCVFIWGNDRGAENRSNENNQSATVLMENNFNKLETNNEKKSHDLTPVISAQKPTSENIENAGTANIREYHSPLENIPRLNSQPASASSTPENKNRINNPTHEFLENNVSDLLTINEEDNGLELNSTYTSQLLPLLPIDLFNYYSIIKWPNTSEPDDSSDLIDPIKNKRWRLGVTVGTNFLATHFNGHSALTNFGETLNEAHRGEFGKSMAVYGEFKLNKKLSVSSGLECFSTRTRFDMVQQWDTVMWRNNLPGGDLINARATRTIVHHNRQDYISVPIMVGMSKDLGRLHVGLSGGAAFNFFLSQKGRTLNAEGEIADIGGGQLPFRKTFLSIQLQPQINYRLTRDLGIGLQPILRWQPHGQSSFYGLRQNTLLIGVGMGLFLSI